MASDKSNALAELAHTLCGVVVDNRYYATIGECIDAANAIGKARLIIAELAKVSLYESIYCKGSFTADVNTVDVILKCRAIAAEEGAKNDNA